VLTRQSGLLRLVGWFWLVGTLVFYLGVLGVTWWPRWVWLLLSCALIALLESLLRQQRLYEYEIRKSAAPGLDFPGRDPILFNTDQLTFEAERSRKEILPILVTVALLLASALGLSSSLRGTRDVLLQGGQTTVRFSDKIESDLAKSLENLPGQPTQGTGETVLNWINL
jgi:hypothetical protein